MNPKPLRYLHDQRNSVQKIIGSARAAGWMFLLFLALMVANFFQVLSFLFMPVSRWFVWKVNREAAQAWWALLVYWTEKRLKVDVRLMGDEVPYGENAIVIANHQEMPDIPVLMSLAIRKGRLGDLKWFVKDPLKYIPGIGWGMVLLGCVFLKRNWFSDRSKIEETFARLSHSTMPFWLVSFVEGTRIRPHKLLKAQEYARARKLPVPNYSLIPKRKGFIVSVDKLGARVDAVYDVTIFYADGIPSLWQYATGLCRTVYLHVKRTPIDQLPKSDEELSVWLFKQYQEKDEMLARWTAERS